MNARAVLVRSLAVFAIGEAVAIAVFVVLWSTESPVLPAPMSEVAARGAAPRTVDAATSDPVAVPSDAPEAPEVAPPPPPSAAEVAVLYGTVSSADGTAVRAGYLWLAHDGTNLDSASLQQDNTFAFAGLSPGTYRLTSRIEDELPIFLDVEVRAPMTRVDVVLDARQVVRIDAVTPQGEPLIAAVGKLSHDLGRTLAAAAFAAPLAGDMPPSEHAAIRAGIGAFRQQDPFGRTDSALPAQAVGVLIVPGDRPAHVALLLRNHVVAQQQLQAGQEVMTFTIDPATFARQHLARVSMRLVTADGMPVVGARVSMTDAQTGRSGEKTGDDGRITIEGLAPGRLDLSIRHQDLCGPFLLFDVHAGADMDLGDIVLREPVVVEISMENFEGKGSVRWNALDVSREGSVADTGYASSGDNNRVSYNFYPGRYGFLASAPNGVALVELDLQQPLGRPLTFDLRPGAPLTIAGRVDGGALRCEVRSPLGSVIRRRELSGSSDERMNLPVGQYVIALTGTDGAVRERTIELGADGLVVRVP